MTKMNEPVYPLSVVPFSGVVGIKLEECDKIKHGGVVSYDSKVDMIRHILYAPFELESRKTLANLAKRLEDEILLVDKHKGTFRIDCSMRNIDFGKLFYKALNNPDTYEFIRAIILDDMLVSNCEDVCIISRYDAALNIFNKNASHLINDYFKFVEMTDNIRDITESRYLHNFMNNYYLSDAITVYKFLNKIIDTIWTFFNDDAVIAHINKRHMFAIHTYYNSDGTKICDNDLKELNGIRSTTFKHSKLVDIYVDAQVCRLKHADTLWKPVIEVDKKYCSIPQHSAKVVADCYMFLKKIISNRMRDELLSNDFSDCNAADINIICNLLDI